jgi:ATP-binding cassette, subfamily B, bacterial MsbA
MRGHRTSTPTDPADPYAKISWRTVFRLLGFAQQHRGRLILAGCLMLVSTAIALSLPLVARFAVDQVVGTGQIELLDRLALLIGGLIVISAGVGFTQHILVAYTGNRIVKEVRHRLFSHLQRLPVSFFDRTRAGDLTSNLSNDVSMLQQTLTDDLVKLAGNLITLFGGIILAIVIDWKLTLVVVTLLTVTMSFFVVFGRRLRRLSRASLDALADAMGTMTEALSNIRLVKAFAREPHEDSRSETKLDQVFRLNMRTSVHEGAMGSVGGTGFILVLLGVVWFGGRSVLAGDLTAGSLLAFLLTITIISGPMASLASLYSRLQRAVGAADRIFAILDDAQEPADPPESLPFPEGPGRVEFRDLMFGYLPEVPVLKGLDLELPAGQVTALVGHSGSGKTTVAALLYRFYVPQSGTIAIDGVSVDDMRRSDLRGRIGIVPQDSMLFNGTIRDNIRYGRLDASDEEVEQAATAANVTEFVSGFPEGFETMVGERGVTLSGGQRQRVSIARALLKDPSILVLDEATSALDTKSESLVREALERLMRGRTTLVIAHRLSTIQDAHQIAVIDDGRIVELGRHEDLLRLGGRYAELYERLPEAIESER